MKRRYDSPAMRFVVPVDGDPASQDCVGFVPNLIDAPLAHKARLVWMKPGAFLDLVDPHFEPLPSSIEWLREAAAAGRCFAPLLVWPDAERWVPRESGQVGVLPHEGRNRAWLARELGVERVPVLIMRRMPEHWTRRQWRTP